MLAKHSRLRKDKEIKQVYQSRIKVSTKHTQVSLQRTNTNQFQLLVVVSKKIFKKANKRNRTKRKIIAIFEKLSKDNRLPPNLASIIQVKNKNILQKRQDEIREEIVSKISETYLKYFKNS